MEPIQDILAALSSGEPQASISDFEFGCARNELLCFLKPEALAADPKHIENTLGMVFEKFRRHGARVSGILLLGGRRIEEAGIMDRHYGFINQLSRRASSMISAEQRARMLGMLGLDPAGKFRILGGHEFLAAFPGFAADSLDALWSGKKSMKLQSGFYFQQYEVKGETAVLVNAFHPAQLAWYTAPSHRTLLLLLRSQTDWRVLRRSLAGDTFPEKAEADSIRGEFFARKERYGLKSVSVACNCVHLSAGPFEALFEIDNFLSRLPGVAFDISSTGMARLMAEAGLRVEEIRRAASNPRADIDGASKDLFGSTEERNSCESLELYFRHYRS